MTPAKKLALADSMDAHAGVIESAASAIRSNARIVRASAEQQAIDEKAEARWNDEAAS